MSTRRRKSLLFQLLVDLFFICIIAILIYALVAAGRPIAGAGESIPLTLEHLPAYTLRSLLRMTAAYIISLLFSLTYGYVAASSPMASKVMIPALDVLQSVPVLGFFPAAVYFFVQLFHGSNLGVELASIFLIFTGQAWNMTFGVYESLTTIPRDLSQALKAFGVEGVLAMKRLYLPATVSKLIYNSMLSWAGGWYFLIACEIITFGPVRHTLPGLGSFLIRSAEAGRLDLAFAGLCALVLVIILLNAFIWGPLLVWGEKYKYELTSAGAVRSHSFVLELLQESFLVPKILRMARSVQSHLVEVLEGFQGKKSRLPRPMRARASWVARPGTRAKIRSILLWGTLVVIAWVGWRGVVSLGQVLAGPWPYEVRLIPAALGASTVRLFVAYLISLAWTLPVAIWMGLNQKVGGTLMPIAQVMASVPATALFPVIILLFLRLSGGINLVSVLLVLTGMQWYILFNLVAGVRSIPADLLAAAKAYQVKGMLFLKKVVLPGMFPSLVTGSITGWGGGWNALIVSEYVVYAGQTYKAFGIGSLLDEATYETGDTRVILLALLSMVLFITVMNRLLWRPLYDHAARRYRIEY
ncbi:MAG TPA: ABC transporter permease subunit [Firmicutes bacterium]|nr:ABC transporter permease subunit [Bacillota bacterium]